MRRGALILAALGLCLLLLLLPGQTARRSEPENWTRPQSDVLDSLCRRTVSPISPYDELLRSCADSIGWDWRLLAAVVYHESRFHNEACSQRGALGLMQINSPRYSAEQLLDPATNLRVGSRYLARLQDMFEAADPAESVNFALAAFNLGDGKMKQLRSAASEAGLDPTRWENVAGMLPKGHHTVSYVNKVLDTYASYSEQYPR